MSKWIAHHGCARIETASPAVFPEGNTILIRSEYTAWIRRRQLADSDEVASQWDGPAQRKRLQ